MAEAKSATGRILEGLVIGAGTSALTFLGSIIWPAVGIWLRRDFAVPGWMLALACIIALTAVFVVARAKLASAPTYGSALKPSKSPRRPAFTPNELQVKCVEALRFIDDEWILLDNLAQSLPEQPRADVRQAMEGLVKEGWVKNQFNAIDGVYYRLADPGLDYARQRGFPARRRSGYD